MEYIYLSMNVGCLFLVALACLIPICNFATEWSLRAIVSAGIKGFEKQMF
jgi:hypothetical protein